MDMHPVRIHPDNGRIFQFRGKPVVLVCATEHYGAVMNRPFDFTKYLADAAEKKQTLTRLFVLFRELQTPINPYSSCKPESPDYISPFRRTGPGKALDGQPKYDLTQWNPEFFSRLHRFLALAGEYGIIVELTMLSNTYSPEVWALNPLNAANNMNDIETIHWAEYLTRRHPKLFERQAAHVRKLVEETRGYDHVIYEICNEPRGNYSGADNLPSSGEVNEWQRAIARIIRQADTGPSGPHLVSGQESVIAKPWEQPSDFTFGEFEVDVVNIHPLPNTTYKGVDYHLGDFMSKQLTLRELRDFCLAAANERKPLNLDEDNIASQYKDPEGWTIHRKRAWTALLCGCHYDYIDFSITPHMEAGTPESQRHIRSWMKHLSEFVHSVNLVKARPAAGLLTAQPAHTVASAFVVDGEDYCVYLADGRELEEEGAGAPIEGVLQMDLPAGIYSIACYSPVSGLYSPETVAEGGTDITVRLTGFVQDIVVRITRK